MELGNLEYEITEKFLADLKKEFGEDKKVVKVAEIRKLQQEGRIMKEFIQEFRRATRGSDYKERLLVE